MAAAIPATYLTFNELRMQIFGAVPVPLSLPFCLCYWLRRETINVEV